GYRLDGRRRVGQDEPARENHDAADHRDDSCRVHEFSSFLIGADAGVGGFAVLREIEAQDLFVLVHAQGDEEVDDFKDDEGADNRPAPGGAAAHQLDQDLLRVAVEETVGGGRVDCDRGDEPGRQRTPGPADAVDRPDVEGIVDVDPLAQLDGQVADHARAEPDHDRTHDVDKTRGRGDGNQAGDGTRGRSDHAGLLLVPPA